MLVGTVEKLEISGAQPSWLWGRWASCLPDHESQARGPRAPQAGSLCLRRILDNLSPQVFNRAMLDEEIQYRASSHPASRGLEDGGGQLCPHFRELRPAIPGETIRGEPSRRRILDSG